MPHFIYFVLSWLFFFVGKVCGVVGFILDVIESLSFEFSESFQTKNKFGGPLKLREKESDSWGV